MVSTLIYIFIYNYSIVCVRADKCSPGQWPEEIRGQTGPSGPTAWK